MQHDFCVYVAPAPQGLFLCWTQKQTLLEAEGLRIEQIGAAGFRQVPTQYVPAMDGHGTQQQVATSSNGGRNGCPQWRSRHSSTNDVRFIAWSLLDPRQGLEQIRSKAETYG